MSRKHFIAIAATIKNQIEVLHSVESDDDKFRYALSVLEITAKNLANEFSTFNANFDRQRFLAACGI